MLAWKRCATASLVTAALAGSVIAQQFELDALLGRLSSAEITSDTGPVVSLRAVTKQSDDAAPADLAISCHRGANAGKFDMLAVQDHKARTDDRWALKIGSCDALVNAVAQRNRAQER
jgi:hypothetical protein